MRVLAAEALLKNARESCRSRQCEDSIKRIQELLFLEPDNFEVHYQLGICFSGGCQTHSLTDPEKALGHFRSSLELTNSSTSELARARILGALGNTYSRSSRLPALERLELAIDCYRQAADIYLADGKLDDWSREQNNLGLAKCELPEGYSNKWREAIDHFRQALFTRTSVCNPLRHAATLQNLGTAYRASPSGDRWVNVRRAIDCYHQALRIYRAGRVPEKSAAVHNNLANAYLTLPSAGQCRNRIVRRALRHFAQALEVFTRTEFPCDYALTQFNRGQALFELRESGSDVARDQVTACFQEAKECFELCGETRRAAQAQGFLNRCRAI